MANQGGDLLAQMLDAHTTEPAPTTGARPAVRAKQPDDHDHDGDEAPKPKKPKGPPRSAMELLAERDGRVGIGLEVETGGAKEI